MSTRSRIGILNDDGSVDSIYCHFDGYPGGVGEMLLDNYNDLSKIKQLLALGDISALGTTVEITKQDSYNNCGEDTEALHSASVYEFLESGEEYNYLFKDGKWHVTGHEHDDAEVTKELIELDS